MNIKHQILHTSQPKPTKNVARKKAEGTRGQRNPTSRLSTEASAVSLVARALSLVLSVSTIQKEMMYTIKIGLEIICEDMYQGINFQVKETYSHVCKNNWEVCKQEFKVTRFQPVLAAQKCKWCKHKKQERKFCRYSCPN